MWVAFAFLGGVIIGAVGAVFLILWHMIPKIERLYVFRPARDILKTPEDLGIPFDQCFIDTPDGARLCAWHLNPPNALGSIVYFHGNGGNLGVLSEILGLFYKNGLQVLAVDYRGYGWSTGSPTEEGLYQDAETTARYFLENFRKDRLPVVYWGRSLGGAAASYAASKVAPDGLVLETAFPSKAALVEHYPQFRPFFPFSRYKFDTVGHLRGHQFPVLLVHGDKDRTVPLEQGQVLYTKLTGPKEFWRVDGAGHIDIHMVDTARYMERIIGFVRRVTPELVN